MSNKPLGHKCYGSISHLSKSRLGPSEKTCTKGQEHILTENIRDSKDLIIVQQKLDGSNCTVAKISGDIIALTRSGYVATSSPFYQHILFNKWVEKNKHRFDRLLMEGERISGEWLVQAHGTRYNLSHEPYVVFDIFTNLHNRIPYKEFANRALKEDFILPQLLHLGESVELEIVLKKINPNYHGAIDEVEGVVYRCERNDKCDFLAKYVRPDKEDGKYFPKNSGEQDVWNSINGVKFK